MTIERPFDLSDKPKKLSDKLTATPIIDTDKDPKSVVRVLANYFPLVELSPMLYANRFDLIEYGYSDSKEKYIVENSTTIILAVYKQKALRNMLVLNKTNFNIVLASLLYRLF